MPNLGPTELIIILIIAIVIFGAGRIAEVGGALGKAIREFRQASQGLDEQKSEEEKSSPHPEGKEEA